ARDRPQRTWQSGRLLARPLRKCQYGARSFCRLPAYNRVGKRKVAHFACPLPGPAYGTTSGLRLWLLLMQSETIFANDNGCPNRVRFVRARFLLNKEVFP